MSYREMLPWAVAPCLIILVAGIGVSCLVYRNLSHEQVEPTQFCIHRSSSFWVLRMNVELVLTQLVSGGDWSCFPVASRDSSEPCGGCTRPHLATERPLDAFPGNLFRISRWFSINSWTLCVKQLQTQSEQGFGCIQSSVGPELYTILFHMEFGLHKVSRNETSMDKKGPTCSCCSTICPRRGWTCLQRKLLCELWTHKSYQLY